SLKTFLRIAAEQPEVETLSLAMANEAAVISEVFRRALALSALAIEGERETEGDAAMATFLWLLGKHRRDLASTAAETLRDRRQFFWARKLANEVEQAAAIANGSAREGPKETP